MPFRSLPQSDAFFTVAMPDGAELPVYGIDGPPLAPVLLFGHANGMAAGSYGPWLRRLAQRARIFAFDARGHGGATWPAGPVEHVFAVDRMADDLAQVTRAVAAHARVSQVAYAGHSLGGIAALRLLACADDPGWSALVIVEPPVFPPPGTSVHDEAVAKQIRLVAGTLKRRVRWPGPQALAERLRGRGMFARFDAAMLDAHCSATLRPAPGGGYELCCPPGIESFIFRSHWEADTWSRLSLIERNIELIGGDPDVPDNDWVSGALPAIAAALPHARLEQVKGAGHLLIAEKPELCARLVWERIGV